MTFKIHKLVKSLQWFLKKLLTIKYEIDPES